MTEGRWIALQFVEVRENLSVCCKEVLFVVIGLFHLLNFHHKLNFRLQNFQYTACLSSLVCPGLY